MRHGGSPLAIDGLCGLAPLLQLRLRQGRLRAGACLLGGAHHRLCSLPARVLKTSVDESPLLAEKLLEQEIVNEKGQALGCHRG